MKVFVQKNSFVFSLISFTRVERTIAVALPFGSVSYFYVQTALPAAWLCDVLFSECCQVYWSLSVLELIIIFLQIRSPIRRVTWKDKGHVLQSITLKSITRSQQDYHTAINGLSSINGWLQTVKSNLLGRSAATSTPICVIGPLASFSRLELIWREKLLCVFWTTLTRVSLGSRIGGSLKKRKFEMRKKKNPQ